MLLRKSDTAENLTRDLWACSQELWPLDHRGRLRKGLNYGNACYSSDQNNVLSHLLSKTWRWKQMKSKMCLLFYITYGCSAAIIASAMGWRTKRSEIEFRQGQELFFLYVIQTSSGVYPPPSYLMGTGGLSQMEKRPRLEADHLLPASAEVKKMWVYVSNPP
jgi:hypothetical protein